MNDSELSPESF